MAVSKCKYWNEEHQECATSFEEDIREDERERIIEELEGMLVQEVFGENISDVGIGLEIALKIVKGEIN